MKIKILLVLTAIFALSIAGAAQLKIGVVNPQYILSKMPQKEIVSQKLKSEFGPRNTELLNLRKKINDLRKRIQRDSTTMSPSEITKLERQGQSMVSDIKLKEAAFKEDIQRRQREELQKLQGRIGQAINAVGKRDNYDIILRRDVVMYGKQAFDISPEVLKLITDLKSK